MMKIFDTEYLFAKKPEVRISEKKVINDYGETKAIFFKGEPYLNRDTWNFAYFGVPHSPMPAGGYPAVVLVHGGGGCAFHEWVSFWNKKGYVAVAPDISGQQYGDKSFDGKGAEKNPEGGPSGYKPFGTTLENYKDSWLYHSVCNVIFIQNLLRLSGKVNACKIAITGISWGSVISCIAAGVDYRFSAIAPVYGGGYLHLTPMFLAEDKPPENDRIWLGYFDPVAYLKEIKKPVMFTCGVNDIAFSATLNAKSWALCGENAFFSWRENLEHYHRWRDEENMINVFRFIDFVLNGNPMPFKVCSDAFSGNILTVKVSDTDKSVSAKLVYTFTGTEEIRNQARSWQSVPAVKTGNTFTAEVPCGAKLFFMQISDGKDAEFVLSTKMYIE